MGKNDIDLSVVYDYDLDFDLWINYSCDVTEYRFWKQITAEK